MLLTPSGVAVLAALTGCPAPAELPAPPANRPTYAMTVSIAAGKKVVHGTSRVSFALERGSDRIVFRLRSVADAIIALRRREHELSQLAARVDNAFRHVGLGHVLDPRHLSVTGAPEPSAPAHTSSPTPQAGGPATATPPRRGEREQ